MLILAKTVLAIMLGYLLSLITGCILIPLLKRKKVNQKINLLINKSHLEKKGTPTLGGLIFIIPTILSLIVLYFRGSIKLTHNLALVVFAFLSYGALGFLDDYLKLKRKTKKTNDGLKSWQKFILEIIIALIFYAIYKYYGGNENLTISLLKWDIPLGWSYGLFILLVLVSTTNAVNITDGLDGLAGVLSALAFVAFGLTAWGTTWLSGNQDIAIFCFLLVGSLIGFLMFNSYPAKIFMGDTGSLALGSALATVAILTRHEFSLILVGGVFVIETITSLLQILWINKFHKKLFLKAPLHHHFEELGWHETDIVKLFLAVGFIFAMVGIIYNIWL